MRNLCILLVSMVTAPMLGAQERPVDWKVRFDNPAADMAALEFVTMAPGWHITTGPAGILFNPENQAAGRFRVSSTIFLFDPGRRHREAYGVFFGGTDLEGGNQAYSYFLIRDTGEFLIKLRRGASTETVVPWTASDAIMKYPGGDQQAKNVLAVECGAESVDFFVNDRKVTSVPRGRVMTDGVVGLRVNHSLNLHVSELLIEPRGRLASRPWRPGPPCVFWPPMPSIPSFQPPPLAGERRVGVERRLGERRQRARSVTRERRRTADRRHPLGRRETADGHLRHAIQMVADALGRSDVPDPIRGALERSTYRMWLSLREVERLVASHRKAGLQVRKSTPEPLQADEGTG